MALGHDLGHTPFGHTGEDALDACMAGYGGFDHNSHGLRLVTELERRYADFDGLNLTQETLEGLVKHNGPLVDADGTAARTLARARRSRRDPRLRPPAEPASRANTPASRRRRRRSPTTSPMTRTTSTTACAPACSISPTIRAVPFVAALLDEIERRHPGLERPRVIHELTRRVITRFIEDAIAESQRPHRRRRRRPARRRAAGGQAAGRLLAADGGGRPRHQGVSVRQHVSPPAGDDGCASGPTRWCGRLFSAYVADPAAMPPRLGGQGRRERSRARPRRRRLHRRHDRSLRHERISPAF